MGNRNKSTILKYLETAYTGARALGDEEMQLRIGRAIVAFEADVYEDIFMRDIIENQIAKKCKESYLEKAETANNHTHKNEE